VKPRPPVELSEYDNSWYNPGRSLAAQTLWFLVGSPFLRCNLNPFSSLKVAILRLFGARIGKGVVLKPGLHVKYPWHLIIGDNCWIGEDAWLDNLGLISLGNNVCISQGAYLCTGNHDWRDPRFGLIVREISLLEGSWVGARSFIGPGVEIGRYSIASAATVVTRNIPDLEIHAGNPAAFVRRRDFASAPLQAKGKSA